MTRLLRRRDIAGLFAVLTLFAGQAAAAPQAVARYNDWRVYIQTVDGDTLCYAATEATDKAPKQATHGDVWFYVTNWKSGKARNQPSMRVGYELREDLPSRARVGRSAWSLFNVGGEAFADDGDEDNLVRAIERGSELRVEGVSARETSVAYHFSLKGSAKAIREARSACS